MEEKSQVNRINVMIASIKSLNLIASSIGDCLLYLNLHSFNLIYKTYLKAYKQILTILGCKINKIITKLVVIFDSIYYLYQLIYVLYFTKYIRIQTKYAPKHKTKGEMEYNVNFTKNGLYPEFKSYYYLNKQSKLKKSDVEAATYLSLENV